MGFSALMIVFFLGVTASFSPCLFPILPSFLAFIVKAGENPLRGLIAASLVTLGAMTIFVLLGFVTSNVLLFFSKNFTYFKLLQGVLLLVIGILILLRIDFQASMMSAINTKIQTLLSSDRNPWIVSYLLGLVFTLIAAPCAVIYFIAVFTLAASETVFFSMAMMLVFSTGLGVPFFLLGFVFPLFSSPQHLSHDIQRLVQNIFPRIAGGIIVLVGLFLIIDSGLFGFLEVVRRIIT